MFAETESPFARDPSRDLTFLGFGGCHIFSFVLLQVTSEKVRNHGKTD